MRKIKLNGEKMKKKLLVGMLCIGIGLTVIACGNKTKDLENDVSVHEKDSLDNNEEESDPENKKDDTENNKEEDDKKAIYKNLPVVLFDGDNAVDILLDGNVVEICNFGDKKDYFYYHTKKVIGDRVYIIKTDYSSDEINSVLEVYDFDGNKEFDYVFEKSATDMGISEYEGNAIISYQAYNGYSYENSNDYRVYTYSPKTKAFDYSKRYSEILTNSKKSGLLFPNYVTTVFDSKCNDDNTVYAWDASEKAFVLLDASTMEVKEKITSDIADKAPFCECFDGDMAVMSVTDDYISNDFYVADIRTGKSECVLSGQYSFISAVDGKMYYYLKDTESYINKKYEVYSLDMNTKESKKLYECKGKPGDGYVLAGVTGFTVEDGMLVFQDTDEKGFFWRAYNLKKDKFVDKQFGYVEKGFGRYATLESYDVVKRANVCGEEPVYFDGYVEKVILNSSISNYEKINEDLAAVYNLQIETAQRCEESSLEWLQEVDNLDYYSASSFECSLNSITEIGSHYLQVDFGAYEYMGGAHGYGYNVTMLYDLNTGAEVHLNEICGVDFETFKKILIAKTIEDWRYGDEYKYYTTYDGTAETEMDFYNMLAEDIVDFERYPVYYNSNGIVISYPAYTYGPYSSGDIPIDISYEELCMDMNK